MDIPEPHINERRIDAKKRDKIPRKWTYGAGYYPAELPRRAGSCNDAREMHTENTEKRRKNIEKAQIS